MTSANAIEKTCQGPYEHLSYDDDNTIALGYLEGIPTSVICLYLDDKGKCQNFFEENESNKNSDFSTKECPVLVQINRAKKAKL
jgi:hypothetical protein